MSAEPIGTVCVECLTCHAHIRVNVFSEPTMYVMRPPDLFGVVEWQAIAQVRTTPIEHECTAGAA